MKWEFYSAKLFFSAPVLLQSLFIDLAVSLALACSPLQQASLFGLHTQVVGSDFTGNQLVIPGQGSGQRSQVEREKV